MGNVISSAANGIGGLVGDATAAPFKKALGDRCKDICSGAWNLKCFIDHLCVAELARLLMTCVLCFIILVFFYLWFELGICQCIARSLCKMCCGCCEASSFGLGEILCFAVQKMKNTRRVNGGRRRRRRRRFQDIEQGLGSSSHSESLDNGHSMRMSGRRLQFQDIEQGFNSSSQSESSNDDHSRRLGRRRQQFQDIEQGFTSSCQSESFDDDHSPTIKEKRKSTRKDESIHQHSPLSHSYRPSNHNSHQYHHSHRVRMKKMIPQRSQSFNSSSESESFDDEHSPTIKEREKSTRKDENIWQRSSLNHSDRPSNGSPYHRNQSHRVRLKTRNVSVRLKGSSQRLRSSRRKQRRGAEER